MKSWWLMREWWGVAAVAAVAFLAAGGLAFWSPWASLSVGVVCGAVAFFLRKGRS